MLTGYLYSVGTTRGLRSVFQTSATQASRNTKSPQYPTPHSTTPRSSKNTGKFWAPVFAPHPCHSKQGSHMYLLYVALQQPPVFIWWNTTGSPSGHKAHVCHPARSCLNLSVKAFQHFSVWCSVDWGSFWYVQTQYSEYCVCVCERVVVYIWHCVGSISKHLLVSNCNGRPVCDGPYMHWLVFLCLCV